MRKIVLAAALATALAAALPALAAAPAYKGSVVGFKISMPTKPTKPGPIKLVITDKESSHNFHLTGPGVNVTTTVPFVGVKTFNVTLKKGTYKFVCDPHASFMKGSFTIK